MSERVTRTLIENQTKYLASLMSEVSGRPVTLSVGQLTGLYWEVRDGNHAEVVGAGRTKSECSSQIESAIRCLNAIKHYQRVASEGA